MIFFSKMIINLLFRGCILPKLDEVRNFWCSLIQKHVSWDLPIKPIQHTKDDPAYPALKFLGC